MKTLNTIRSVPVSGLALPVRNMGTFRLLCLLWSLLLASLLLTGCAGVKTASVSTSDYVSLRRGDVLTTGHLSADSLAALQVLGLDATNCRKEPAVCHDELSNNPGLMDEQRTATLAELWLQQALDLHAPEQSNDRLHAYLQTARHAYAYLFFTERFASERALEDRQTRVRDYYNYAVQEAVTRLFADNRQALQDSLDRFGNFSARTGNWEISGKLNNFRLSRERQLPRQLIPAASLTFKGLRNQYRRDGVGAELVAVMAKRVVTSQSSAQAYSETPFPALTLVLRFPGDSLEEVLATNAVRLMGFDPYRQDHVTLAGQYVPLAANYTSGYGLWLARSGFANQSLLTLIGRGDILEQPHVYLMQPYDPRRRIIVLLHGLASSPEAWINVANEILGDESLRQNYQIWQVYYPTNAPIAVNHSMIRDALQETLQELDPHSRHTATRDLVLIGHSMGGVLARLMVSSSGDLLWDNVVKRYQLKGQRKERVRDALKPYAWFRPMPQVQRAIFIAAPHRGTPVAEYRLVRWTANLIKLPFSVLGRMTEVAHLLVDPTSANTAPLNRGFTSIDNLSDRDPFIRATAGLPIADGLPYHSIIGHDNLKIPLQESSDGVVPYQSARLPGARSEKVVHSWHSVQETPAAILEIRRILHEHLQPAPHTRETL